MTADQRLREATRDAAIEAIRWAIYRALSNGNDDPESRKYRNASADVYRVLKERGWLSP